MLARATRNVRREDYLGPGPWPILHWGGGYLATPDVDLAWLFADVLVGIVPERDLNNGQPSAHAMWIAAAAPAMGEHVVHVGAGRRVLLCDHGAHGRLWGRLDSHRVRSRSRRPRHLEPRSPAPRQGLAG